MLKINSAQSVSLDLVRLLAAQLVLIGHSLSFLNISEDMSYIQNIGVVLFFILSGLIISYTVFYKSQYYYTFRLFLIERFARIYTGLVPSLLFIAVADFAVQHYNVEAYQYSNAYNIKTFIGNLFMLQDYQDIGHYLKWIIPESLHITSFGSGRPLWTLSIEWWLYMSFGLIYFFYAKSFSWKYILVLIFVSIEPVWNLLYGPSRAHGLTIFWLFGMLATLLVFRPQALSRSLALVLSIMFLFFSIIIVVYTQDAYSVRFAFFMASFLFFMLLYQQKNLKVYNGAFSKTIKFLAGYSFTLYLVHYTILDIIIALHLSFDKYILAIFSFFIVNFIAMGIAVFTEMKHKVFAKKLKTIVGISHA